MRRRLIRAMGRVHLLVHRVTRGRALGRVAGMPVLFLTTTGRRSGKQRTTPLTYFRDGDDLAVIASNGGEDRPPAWSLNLLEQPRALVELEGRAVRVRARVASDEERARLWPAITARYGGYARYEQRTTRPIPVFVLTPES